MKRPNIVFLVLDAVRLDHCSTYGYERETTPTMSSLASEGVRYDHAFAPSIWTPTVHGSIFTGGYPSHTGIYGNSLEIPESLRTIPEQLQEQGYRTFAASAGAHIRASRGYDRGVDDYVETRRIAPDRDFIRKTLTDASFAKQVLFTLTCGPDDKTRYKYDRLKRFVDGAIDDDTPFFGFINAKTAHQPFNPPRPYKKRFSNGFERPRWEFQERLLDSLGRETQRVPDQDMEKLRRVSHSGGDGVLAGEVELSDKEWHIIESWYDGAIRYLDDLIGELLDFLRERGIYEETMIVVTSDHGDNFGDHDGMTSHIFCLYDTLLHVPLVIKPPTAGNGARPSNRLVGNQVSLIDLHPTFLEAAGASVPDYDLSESLLDFEDKQYHEYTFAEYAGFDGPISRLRRKFPNFDAARFAQSIQSVRNSEHKLIEYSDAPPELYAWREDPDETENLVEHRSDTANRLSAVIEEKLEPLADPGEFETPDDAELESQLKDLGYL